MNQMFSLNTEVVMTDEVEIIETVEYVVDISNMKMLANLRKSTRRQI